jgi:hypothetical protein
MGPRGADDEGRKDPLLTLTVIWGHCSIQVALWPGKRELGQTGSDGAFANKAFAMPNPKKF